MLTPILINLHHFCVPSELRKSGFIYECVVGEARLSAKSALGSTLRIGPANYKSLQRTLDIGHINSYTPGSLAHTLGTSGLAVHRVELFDHSQTPPRKAGSMISRATSKAITR